VISVVLLAVIAAAVSFGHMRELALRHGEAQWSATLIPLSADGMVVAATAAVGLAVALAVAAVTPDGTVRHMHRSPVPSVNSARLL
jgi:hypothetical protein